MALIIGADAHSRIGGARPARETTSGEIEQNERAGVAAPSDVSPIQPAAASIHRIANSARDEVVESQATRGPHAPPSIEAMIFAARERQAAISLVVIASVAKRSRVPRDSPSMRSQNRSCSPGFSNSRLLGDAAQPNRQGGRRRNPGLLTLAMTARGSWVSSTLIVRRRLRAPARLLRSGRSRQVPYCGSSATG
jgi:hypothetical protein